MHGATLVRERIARLRAQWVAFAARVPARLLVWRADPDELSLVSLFLDVEADPKQAETPDLILQLTSPFTDEATHGFTLASELVAHYAEAAEDATADSGSVWFPEASIDDDDDAGALLGVLASFHAHHGDIERGAKLGVWLDPKIVSDEAVYLRWLRRVLRRVPGELRFLIIEAEAASSYEALALEDPERVEMIRCALDVPDMLEAVAAGPSAAATPGDRYRYLLVRLGNARDGLAQARARADEASQIALDLDRPALAAVARVMLAATCVEHGQHGEALQRYAEAERFAVLQEAREGAEAGAPHGAKIRLMARLGGAATMFSVGAFEAAGQAYLGAAPLARAAEDVGMLHDCHRLASLCFAREGLVSMAWEVGMQGLGAHPSDDGSGTPALLRLAAQLVQLTTDHRALRDYERPLDTQLAHMLGADWRAQLAGAGIL